MTSYTLDTGKKYIKDIFASDCFYNIPEYQRPYVWGEDEVIVLLDDLTKAMERDKKKEYFLGCMIWNTKKVKNGEIDYVCQDILDGQQRFITLYLMQAVIRDLSTSSDLKKKVAERMMQEKDEFDNIPERNRIEFAIRDDREFLDKYVLVKGGTDHVDSLENVADDNNSEISVRNMAKAIIAMRRWWLEKSEDKNVPDFQIYLRKFYGYLSSQVLALFLATPDNLDDAYNLFTVLNSRGLKLQVSDILRAQNLRVIEDTRRRKDYAKRWGDYENSIDLPYRSFDDFLWAVVFMRMKYRSDDNKSLNTAFNFMYNRGLISRGSDTFDHIGKYVEHYRSIFENGIHGQATGYFFTNLTFILTSTFGNTYAAPLMHFRECFGEYRVIEFLIKLDNLFSASWLLGKRNLQIRVFIILRKMEEMLKLFGSVEEAADAFIADDVLCYEYQDEKASTSMKIDDLYDLFDQERWGSFSGSKINKTRYLLLKLNLLSSNLESRLTFEKSRSSVEHLMPQTLNPTNWDTPENVHREWVHRLGNIVLVDRKKNSSLSNSSYSTKKERYTGSIESRANTNYVFMTFNDWSIESIQKNHSRVVGMLKAYYDGNSLETLREITSYRKRSVT